MTPYKGDRSPFRYLTSEALVALRIRLRADVAASKATFLRLRAVGQYETAEAVYRVEIVVRRGRIARITTILRDRWADPERVLSS